MEIRIQNLSLPIIQNKNNVYLIIHHCQNLYYLKMIHDVLHLINNNEYSLIIHFSMYLINAGMKKYCIDPCSEYVGKTL